MNVRIFLAGMKINTKHINKLISNPSILAPTTFIGIGAGKMVFDYQKAKPYEKKRTLIKDAAILAGSVGGFALMNPLTSLFCKKAIFNNQNKIIKDTSYVFKQTLAATLNTFSGVLGAVLANEFIHKYVLNQPYFIPPPSALEETPEKEKTKKVFANFITLTPNVATKAANRFVSNISDLPSMKVLSSPMIALTGFSVANTQGYHNKIKKTTNEILANTLIPTAVISATALFVNNKKSIIKYPALLSALGIGSLIGAYTANKSQQAIEKTIDKINLKYISQNNVKTEIRHDHQIP